MARKPAAPALERGAKTKAIKEYIGAHKKAKPKEVVAALKEQGIDVSPNMVSIIRARLKVRSARRRARGAGTSADTGAAGEGGPQAESRIRSADKAAGLEAALTLYKAAASSRDVSNDKVRKAFLSLVELLG